MNFAGRRKQLRKERHLSRGKFARITNINRSTIAGYETENREPSFAKIIEIADFFGVSIDYFI